MEVRRQGGARPGGRRAALRTVALPVALLSFLSEGATLLTTLLTLGIPSLSGTFSMLPAKVDVVTNN